MKKIILSILMLSMFYTVSSQGLKGFKIGELLESSDVTNIQVGGIDGQVECKTTDEGDIYSIKFTPTDVKYSKEAMVTRDQALAFLLGVEKHYRIHFKRSHEKGTSEYLYYTKDRKFIVTLNKASTAEKMKLQFVIENLNIYYNSVSNDF